MRVFGLLLALLGAIVFAGFTAAIVLEWSSHRPGFEGLSWWIGSGLVAAAGAVVFANAPRRAAQAPPIEAPGTRTMRTPGRDGSPPAAAPAHSPVPPPPRTPVDLMPLTLLAVVAIVVLVTSLGPGLLALGLDVLAAPMRKLPFSPILVPAVVCGGALGIAVIAHYRNSGRRLAMREVGWIGGQALRWMVAIALLGAPFYAIGWIFSGSDPKSREAVGLIGLVFAPILYLVLTVFGALIAWAFLALTRSERPRTIGEIARENEARERERLR